MSLLKVVEDLEFSSMVDIDGSFSDMIIHFLPWYDKTNKTFINIANALDGAFDIIDKNLFLIDRNLNLDSAQEVISHFEKLLGIVNSEDLSFSDRRNRIKAVINLMHSQITEDALKKLCSAFSRDGSFVHIERSDIVDTFNILFRSFGYPKYMHDLIIFLNKEMPSHLAFDTGIYDAENIIFKEKSMSYISPLYFTGVYDTGVIFKPSFVGAKVYQDIVINSSTSNSSNRGYCVNEINTGVVK